MKILMSGSSGLVGTALISYLSAQGHQVSRMVRHPAGTGTGDVCWDPAAGSGPAASDFDGVDAVIHLAGENVAARRWTAQQKARIRDSRVTGTRILSESMARAPRPPRIFLAASAVGFYGDRGDTTLTEDSAAGTGFLPQTCRDWEMATKAPEALIRPMSETSAPGAPEALIRVVQMRLGIVLSAAGGALARMILPFKLGLGGKIGSGRQYMSWISIDDAVSAISHALNTSTLAGPVNLVAPNPVTNAEFTKTLGNVLRRPTIFPMPAAAARLAFGEMADALLLAGARVLPTKLNASGFSFRHPHLREALKSLLAT